MQTAHSAEFAAGKEVGGSVLVLTGRYRPLSVSVYADNAMPAVFGTGQAVAITLLPLSRQGADAVFEERDGHTKVNQALPSDFSVSIAASGQTSLYFKRSGVFRQTLLGNIGAVVAAIIKRI